MFGDPVKNTRNLGTHKFSEVCNAIGDGLHGTPKYDDDGEYYFINGNNLWDKKIVFTPETRRVGQDEFTKHYIALDDSTVLLSINGTLGKTALYNGEKIVLGKSACYCRLKDCLDKVFVLELFKNDAFQEFMNAKATGTTIRNFGLKALRDFKIIVPEFTQQLQFADFIQQADKSKFVTLELVNNCVIK